MYGEERVENKKHGGGINDDFEIKFMWLFFIYRFEYWLIERQSWPKCQKLKSTVGKSNIIYIVDLCSLSTLYLDMRVD